MWIDPARGGDRLDAALVEVVGALEEPEGPRVEAVADEVAGRPGLEHQRDVAEPGLEFFGQVLEDSLGDGGDHALVLAGADAGADVVVGVEAEDLEVVADHQVAPVLDLVDLGERVVGVGEPRVAVEGAPEVRPGGLGALDGPHEVAAEVVKLGRVVPVGAGLVEQLQRGRGVVEGDVGDVVQKGVKWAQVS